MQTVPEGAGRRATRRAARVAGSESVAGASAARNVGFAASDADWVLFLDDDTTPSARARSSLVMPWPGLARVSFGSTHDSTWAPRSA